MPLDQLTEEGLKEFFDIYRSVGIPISHHLDIPVESVKEALRERPFSKLITPQPNGDVAGNRLEIALRRNSSDGRSYIHVTIYPDSEIYSDAEASFLKEWFEQKVRQSFLGGY
jgi:hypothetical protein